jgi:hypothetical protein
MLLALAVDEFDNVIFKAFAKALVARVTSGAGCVIETECIYVSVK